MNIGDLKNYDKITKYLTCPEFGWEDYLVLAFTLLCSALIGVLFAWRGQTSTAEYLLANKQMSVFPTTMSIACSFISAITILGTPAEMYIYGTQYWAIGNLQYPVTDLWG